MPRLSAAEERAEAIHRLSEVMTVVLLNVEPLRASLESLRYLPGLGDPAVGELSRALVILADIRAASYGCVPLFTDLRRVV